MWKDTRKRINAAVAIGAIALLIAIVALTFSGAGFVPRIDFWSDGLYINERSGLNIVQGDNMLVTGADDGANSRVNIELDSFLQFYNGTVPFANSSGINLEAGSGISITDSTDPWHADYTISVSGGVASPCLYVVATADMITTSDTTPNPDDQLFFPVGNSEWWAVKTGILFQQTTATADGFRLNWAMPASTTGSTMTRYLTTSDTSSSRLFTYEYVMDTSDTGLRATTFSGIVETMSRAEGNVQFQWAQRLTSTDITYRRAGSFIIACRMYP